MSAVSEAWELRKLFRERLRAGGETRYYRLRDLSQALTIRHHYGPDCADCGMVEGESYLYGNTTWTSLTLEHSDGGGEQHRISIVAHRNYKARPPGKEVYQEIWRILLETGEWPVGYEVLCWNDQAARRNLHDNQSRV